MLQHFGVEIVIVILWFSSTHNGNITVAGYFLNLKSTHNGNINVIGLKFEFKFEGHYHLHSTTGT